MKALIRPALLMLARLGLFFSVAAWVFHLGSATVWLQWDVPASRLLPGGAAVLLNSEGLYTKVYGRTGFEFVQVSLNGEVPQQQIVFDAVGIKVATAVGDTEIVLRYWLLVTVCALFYAVLKRRARRPSNGVNGGP